MTISEYAKTAPKVDEQVKIVQLRTFALVKIKTFASII